MKIKLLHNNSNRLIYFLFAFLVCSISVQNGAHGQEIGQDDFRISFHGIDGNSDTDCIYPDLIYNETDNEYLVVWSADVIPGELEVFCQRLDLYGNLIGSSIQISSMGTPGNIDTDAFRPHVTWNANNNEYLVVWHGSTDQAPLVAGENEIWGQRLNNLGNEIGIDDFRISFNGPDGIDNMDAQLPGIAWNSANNSYLVVWSGDNDINGESEVWGQFVDASGTLTGSNFQISNIGTPGDDFDAWWPSIVYNSSDNVFAVPFSADSAVVGDQEIFVSLVNGDGPTILSSNVVVSDVAPIGNPAFRALVPQIAWNSDLNEYLVIWFGDHDTLGLVDEEFEVWGQRLSNNLVELGENDFRISHAGVDGDDTNDAHDPHLAYNSTNKEYKIVFEADSTGNGYVEGEFEIFIITVLDTGSVVGTEKRISLSGGIGQAGYDADMSRIVYNPDLNEYLIIWRMEDTLGMLVNNEFEIYGQRYQGPSCATSPVDVSVTQVGITLTANSSEGTFQWINCNNGNLPLNGETNQSYTASSNGDYAVVVTTHACADTSACFNVSGIGFEDHTVFSGLKVYPNPSDDNVTVVLDEINEVTILLFNTTGQLIYMLENISDNPITFELPKSNGLYLLKIISDKNSISLPIIKI